MKFEEAYKLLKEGKVNGIRPKDSNISYICSVPFVMSTDKIMEIDWEIDKNRDDEININDIIEVFNQLEEILKGFIINQRRKSMTKIQESIISGICIDNKFINNLHYEFMINIKNALHSISINNNNITKLYNFVEYS